MTQVARDVRFSPVGVPPGWEERSIEIARRCTDDVQHCRDAEMKIRWIENLPVLVMAFHLPETRHKPALGIALVTVEKGTLSEVLPGRTLLEGDRLRDHLLRSVDHYLTSHGVKLVHIVQN